MKNFVSTYTMSILSSFTTFHLPKPTLRVIFWKSLSDLYRFRLLLVCSQIYFLSGLTGLDCLGEELQLVYHKSDRVLLTCSRRIFKTFLVVVWTWCNKLVCIIILSLKKHLSFLQISKCQHKCSFNLPSVRMAGSVVPALFMLYLYNKY